MCHYAEHQSRGVAVLAADGVRTLDLTGPLEVFDVARTLGCDYTVAIYTCGDTRTVRSSSGLVFDAAPAALMGSAVDTLLVVGGDDLANGAVPQRLQQTICDHAPSARRIAAGYTGSFALAAAGLLDGRRATTHWRHVDALADGHPAVSVDRESVYTRDGEVWTSAGGAAGIDLALALVADDHGAEIAHQISKDVVLLSRRLEGHPQISAASRTPRPRHPGLERLMATVGVDPADDYDLDTVATELGMSPRHLARLFKAQTGMTLRQYVYEVRLENAVGLVLAGESFHAAARRSGLRYGASVRDHLAAHALPPPAAPARDGLLLVDARRAEAAAVYAG